MNSFSSSVSWVETDELNSKVIFTDVDKHFSTQDLECHFQFNGDFVPSTKDYVALIRVEYRSLNQRIAYGNIPEAVAKPQILIFSAKDLPQERNDFYQFIYVRENEVLKESIPFLLQVPHDEIIADEDGDDCLIIRSVESPYVSRNSYQQLFDKCQNLEKENNLLTRHVSLLEQTTKRTEQDYAEKLREKDIELASFQAKQQEEIISLMSSMTGETENIKDEIIKECEAELEEKKEQLTTVLAENEQMKLLLEIQKAQLERLKEENEEYEKIMKEKETRFTNLHVELQQKMIMSMEKWQMLHSKVEECEAELEEKKEQLTTVLAENEQMKLLLEIQKAELERLKEENENYDFSIVKDHMFTTGCEEQKLQKQADDSINEVQKLQDEVADYARRLKEKETELISLRAEHQEELSSMKSSMSDEIQNISDKIGEEYEKIMKEKETHFTHLHVELQQKMIMSMEKWQMLHRKVEEYETQLKEKVEELTSVIAENEQIKSLQETQNAELESLRNEIEECKAQLVEKEERLTSMLEENEENQSLLETREAELETHKRETEGISNELKSMKGIIEIVQNERNELMTEKSLLVIQNATLVEKNITLEKVANKEVNVSELLDQLEEYQDVIQGLQAAKVALERHLSELRSNSNT